MLPSPGAPSSPSPLRERGRKVELLAQAFLDQLEAQEGHAEVFTEETLACMRGHVVARKRP